MKIQEKQETKLPIDAKLLSDAIIELNISRRNVGLYHQDHPAVQASVNKAFSYLRSLFELRSDITLGIARNTLVIDEYKLDSKNPVFREFAQSLHNKGVAAITLSLGLTKEELIEFHKIISSDETPADKSIVEYAKNKNIRHITLSPIDFSAFEFSEDIQRTNASPFEVWEDYVYGLLEGKLSADEVISMQNIPPEDMALLINNVITENAKDDTYEKVITGYLKRKDQSRLSGESLSKFVSFMDRLKPEIKRQFLVRGSNYFSENLGDIEKILREITPDSLQKVTDFFKENSSAMPEILEDLIDKLDAGRKGSAFNLSSLKQNTSVEDDIEIDNKIMMLFGEDHFNTYVSEDYKKELKKMLKSSPSGSLKVDALKKDFNNEEIDVIALEAILETAEADFISAEDYLRLITKLSEYVNIFRETGRFEDILGVYNALSSHALTSRFSQHASSMIVYFFRSENFLLKLIDTFKLWGRKNREGAFRLAKALKLPIISPLLDALLEEKNAVTRKFLLSMLASFGSDVNPHVIKRLDDERWYVIRNMLYLLRVCNGNKYSFYITKFLKHKKSNICLEGLKTLLHFKTPDAFAYLKSYLQSDNKALRNGAIKLAGTYKIKGAIPYLIRLLEKKDVLGSESYYKLDVVKALGEIGDGGSILPLLKICNTKTFLYKGTFEELKVSIFRTLDNYPLDSIRPLIEYGLVLKNKEINSISENLMNKLNASFVKG